MGTFDDLIPKGGKASAFSDLVPAKRKRGLVEDATGVLATINSRIPLADELAAAGQTGANLMTGRIGLGDVRQDFDRSMGRQRGYEADLDAARPRVAGLARGVGDAALVAAPTAKLVGAVGQGSRMVNAARGATMASGTAAGLAATDRGTPGERLEAASQAATNPLVIGLGAGAAMLAPAARKAPARPSVRNSDAAILRDIGVETSLPQRMGGMAKQAEDLAQRAPILGPAVSGARSRQVEQLNRGVGLRALRPVGKTIPKEIQPGFEMVEYVDDQLGQVYDEAARLVPRVALDEQLADDAVRIGARRVDLAESEARQFDAIVGDRLSRLRSGEASGATVKEIHSELGGLQSEAARKGNMTLAGMLGDTRRALMGLIERANPQAADLIHKADEGWQVYSMMNDAAAQASNRGGVFLPGQLNTQVRAAGRRAGPNMTGKGKAPLQDVATAATRMLPDQFGNPGTANAVGLGGLMVGGITEPGTTIGVASGLTAAATPYWMMARKVVEELPANAPPSMIAQADAQLQRLAASDPMVNVLRREVAAKAAVAAGVQARPGALMAPASAP